MFDRLDQIEAKYEELTQALASPETINDSAKYQKTAKAHSEVAQVVERYREYKSLKQGIAESRAMIEQESDPEMRAYAQEELDSLEKRVVECEEELPVPGSQFADPLLLAAPILRTLRDLTRVSVTINLITQFSTEN